MNRPDIETIESVVNAATAGPWRVDAVYDGRSGYDIMRGTDELITVGDDGGGAFAAKADAVLCTMSRSAIPELCAYVRELEAELLKVYRERRYE